MDLRNQTDIEPQPRIPFEVCPLCKGSNTTLLRRADCSRHALYHPIISPIMTWVRCSDCWHVFTDGYFSDDVSAIIFGKTQDNQKPGAEFEKQRFVSARIVAKIADRVPTGLWLDVGFGSGSLLFTAEEWGFTPVGLDLRPSSVEAVKQLGIEAYCADVSSLAGKQHFSVISMADLLEHMPFPQQGLAAARRLLRPEGVLFVSMPHYNCMAWRLLDASKANPYWGELEHFHNFSRTRLYSLAKEVGFEPIHYGVSERYRVCMEVIFRPVV